MPPFPPPLEGRGPKGGVRDGKTPNPQGGLGIFFPKGKKVGMHIAATRPEALW